jgi:hypothetical protein
MRHGVYFAPMRVEEKTQMVCGLAHEDFIDFPLDSRRERDTRFMQAALGEYINGSTACGVTSP